MLVFVEPEAQDFWLDSKEECELVSESSSATGQFEIWHTDEGVTVFPGRDVGSISVFQNGIQLECGHKRSQEW